MEERRQSSIETLLLEIGSLREVATSTKTTISALSDKITVQNGRVGKLEKWQAYLTGMATICVLLLVPITIRYFPEILTAITK